MSSILTLPGYGVNGGTHYIPAANIIRVESISYNGISGAEIHLVSGDSVSVQQSALTVAVMLEQAMQEQES